MLAEMGTISVLHSHLDYMLKMTILTLTGVSISEIRGATNHEGSSSLRSQIKKIGRRELGDGAPLIKLRDLMTRCGRATRKRNGLVHGVYALDYLGYPIMSEIDWSWRPQPTLEELQELSKELQALINEVTTARSRGFLGEALRLKKEGVS